MSEQWHYEQKGESYIKVDTLHKIRTLESELATVTEQRDEARKQRDRLAEACKLLMATVGEPNSSADHCWVSEDEMDAAWNMGNEALQALNQNAKHIDRHE